MGLKTWSFQDNGKAGANGGGYGPFEFDGLGVMFLGATTPNTGAPQGPNLNNIQVRVHPGWKPSFLTGNGEMYPSIAVDGVPLTAGGWFRLKDVVSTWYFSIPVQGLGQPITYWFAIIDREDCEFYAGNSNLETPAVVKKSFTDPVTATPVLVSDQPCLLTGWYNFNSDAAAVYVQFFDTDDPASVTLGTTVPVLSLGIPAGAAANAFEQSGVRTFFNGIVIASTTTRNGNAAPGADTDVDIFFE